MPSLREVTVAAESIARFDGEAPAAQLRRAVQILERAREVFAGRVLWHVNSTPRGGGVAELLRGLLGYVRGAGVDARWVTIEAPPEFFAVTKRLHHALHGAPGDGSPLGEAERRLLEQVAHANAEELLGVLQPGDVVYLHDPQTAAMAPLLARAGARVVWRCHIGTDERNEETERGWRLLGPLAEAARAVVFSRRAFVPSFLSHRAVIIHPSIDIFSAKNQWLAPEVCRAILVHAGLISGPTGGDRSFRRLDGAPGRVDRAADLISTGSAPDGEEPLVVQVSRWDPLKDPIGVIDGFIERMRGGSALDAHLLLAGPSVHAVKDDPEGARTLDAVIAHWRRLPARERSRITLACLPMTDVEENAAIVNALQRHAAVVVQKSLQEGFGLTVTEAMWKRRAVIASAVGGIQEQIVHGESGVLLDSPTDTPAFAVALEELLSDPQRRAALGAAAQDRVREQFLAVRQLTEGMALAVALATQRTVPLEAEAQALQP